MLSWGSFCTPIRGHLWKPIDTQAADSPARRAFSDDVLSFSPWRCLADHQPLGSIMRLRKDAYYASAVCRHKTNKKPMTEPRDISEFPD
jgi:hypothetical protein